MFMRDFQKAYRKARGWGCSSPVALGAAIRYAITGDSGRFTPRKGFQSYRIVRERKDGPDSTS
ncbi:MAG: hypothetical protein ABN502_16765 [Gammaproteobacteria bacterium]|uniref:hypothetical protein n=1 Tax=Xanthomonas boreopolis TaxID=86183 RepID=UPI0032DD8D17